MKLVCAWCGATMDRPGYTPMVDPITSHGMCSACSAALESQERGTSLQRHIDGIPIPILLIDDKDAVIAMNAEACNVLGEKSRTDGSQLFGQVFDCIHSCLPDGCARTIHCSGCAIRRSVTATFNTGEPQVLIPATLSVASPDQLGEAVLSITTVKRDGAVLLRIEQLHRGDS